MIWIQIGSIVMLMGVVLGAFGAHGLKNVLSPEAKQIYQTAVLYHLIHGLALVVTGLLKVMKPEITGTKPAAVLFFIGIVLFSGSLYLLSLTGIKKFGMITPLGGLAFIVGWLMLALSAR